MVKEKFREGKAVLTAKDEIVAGVNLNIIKKNDQVVGFKIFCHRSVNGAAVNFCRNAPELIHKRQIRVSATKSGKALFFCCPSDAIQNYLRFSLDDRQAGKALRDILAEVFGLPHINKLHDSRIYGFEIKIPADKVKKV